MVGSGLGVGLPVVYGFGGGGGGAGRTTLSPRLYGGAVGAFIPMIDSYYHLAVLIASAIARLSSVGINALAIACARSK